MISEYLHGMLQRTFLLVLALTAMSCATVAHGRNETISFDSSPAGASVELRCQQVTRTATTPATVEIPRNATDCVATLAKSGFKTKSVPLDRGVDRAYWLNMIGIAVLPLGISDNSPLDIGGDAALVLIAGGVLGLSIDAFDGAMFRHEPKNVRVTLERE